eukprot:2549190-Alexandrium_andersonii.AAC.1
MDSGRLRAPCRPAARREGALDGCSLQCGAFGGCGWACPHSASIPAAPTSTATRTAPVPARALG